MIVNAELITGSIEDRARFSMYDIEPRNYIKDLLLPAYFVIGQNDEFVPIEEFNEMFIDHPLVKILKAVPGGHNDEREDFIVSDIVRFVVDNFDNPDTQMGVSQYKMDVLESRQKFEAIVRGEKEASMLQQLFGDPQADSDEEDDKRPL